MSPPSSPSPMGKKANGASSHDVLKPERIRKNLETLEKNANKLTDYSLGVTISRTASADDMKRAIAERIDEEARRFAD